MEICEKKGRKMKNNLFLVLVALLCSICISLSQAALHLGCLSTQGDLDRMREKVTAGEQPWKGSWDKLRATEWGKIDWSISPQEYPCAGGICDPRESFIPMARDVAHAYQCALQYHILGDAAYADEAVRTMNAWADTMIAWDGDSNHQLRAGLYGYQWACTAEIMRDYTGWSSTDQNDFKNFLLDKFYTVNSDFLIRHNNTCWDHYWLNWDMATMCSMLSIGVYCDRQDIIDEAIDYFYSGIGTGRITHAFNYLHENNTIAQCQESGRDQGHAVMAVGLVVIFCEIAWHQGYDLYAEEDNLLLKGCEYTARYNLGNSVPFHDYTNCEGFNMTEVSSVGRGVDRPYWDIVVNHYVGRMGLPAPYSVQMADLLSPDGGPGNYESTSGGYDIIGFSTLTHYGEAALSGSLLREWWTGITGTAISDLTSNSNYPDNPSGSGQISSLEIPTNWADNYGTRIRGYIHPPATGSYTFWISGDDNCDLYLSSDSNPAYASLIAYVPGWTFLRQWNKFPEQQSSPITLTGGQMYYIEALHKEGTSGDNMAVSWAGPGLSQQIISGSYLSPWFGNCDPSVLTPYVSIDNDPWQSTTSVSVDPGQDIKFGPQPVTGGTWSWSGPNGYTASTREIILSNIQSSQAGTYTGTFTNNCGSQSSLDFNVTVNTPCEPSTLTPFIQIDGGTWQSTVNASVDSGQDIMFGPRPLTGGTWEWSGPNGYTASIREISLSNIQSNQAGTYTATFTNDCGAQSSLDFNVTVNSSVLSFDAENGMLGSRWTTGSDGNASNDTYLEINPSYNHTSSSPQCTSSECVVTYNFTVSTGDNYKFWFRIMSDNDNDDSFFWRIDSGSWQIENNRNTYGSWYSSDNSMVDSLSAGSHVLEITYRENGTRLDKFVIQPDSESDPTGEGPSENSQG